MRLAPMEVVVPWIFSMAAGGVVVVLASFYGFDLRLNLSNSHKPGIYQVFPVDQYAHLSRGQLILICLDKQTLALPKSRGYIPPGRCLGNAAPLLKRIAGLEGDDIEVSALGVRVNEGELIANTMPFDADSRGRRLTKSHDGRVPSNHLFLTSEYNPHSYDSRYFGFLEYRAVLGTASPLITWD